MLRAQLRLMRWLGPWAADDAVPDSVVRTTVHVPSRDAGERPFDAWLYRPRRGAPVGVYLVAPGLHYAGPADPRMDRFLRILANAGLVVLCPFLPDFIELRVRESVIADFARAFDALEHIDELPRRVRPGVFSISFGSLPALRLASDPRYAERIGAVVPFGGYADFREVIRFSLSGGRRAGEDGGPVPYDPLNRPVVVMNLLDDMEGVPAGVTDVVEAWQRYVRATWGRPEMRVDDRYKIVAEELGAHLSGHELAFYRVGVGLDEGALERCLSALDRSRARRAFLDPRPYLQGVKAPVHLFHGADDDVIPWQQLDALYEALPTHADKARYLTGLYGHTGASALGSMGALLREGVTLVRMLRALVGAATTRA